VSEGGAGRASSTTRIGDVLAERLGTKRRKNVREQQGQIWGTKSKRGKKGRAKQLPNLAARSRTKTKKKKPATDNDDNAHQPTSRQSFT